MDRMLLLGFAPSLDAAGMERLHRADAVFCPSPGRAKYGRAPVHDVTGNGFVRLGGVAVVWGDDSRRTRGDVGRCPDPVVVVVTSPEPADGGHLATAIAAVKGSGRVAEVVVLDGDVLVVKAGTGDFVPVAAEVTGELNKSAPAPAPVKPPPPKPAAKPKPKRTRRKSKPAPASVSTGSTGVTPATKVGPKTTPKVPGSPTSKPKPTLEG